MKLSELVAFKEKIKQAVDTTGAEQSLTTMLTDMSLLYQQFPDKHYHGFIDHSIRDLREMIDMVVKYKDRADDIAAEIDQEISKLTQKFFAANYETEFEYNDPANIRRVRKLYMPGHAVPVLMSRLGLVLDWRYPTLEIGCRDGEWTTHLVAGDPLYIVDTHQEFLTSTMNQFNPEYQRRIRPYLIKDQDFSVLPQQQFGFVFSWNFFNYLSLDSVKHHLQEIFNLLKPGGRVLFSYNNGDLPEAAEHAEHYYMTYMPKSLLLPMCEMLGYDIHDHQDFHPALSWIELQKPGELTTTKAHQVLGTVKRKPLA
jgi:SAM-dependent methyltransferase